MARLRDKYKNEIASALAKEFDIKNPMAIPKIEKIVVNMGLGEGTQNAKIVDTGAEELGKITGQKAAVSRLGGRRIGGAEATRNTAAGNGLGVTPGGSGSK